DLFSAIEAELTQLDKISGEVFNLGGGRACSTSMREMTALCVEAVGRAVPIDSVDTTSPVDIPLYLSDTRKAHARLGWKPRKSAADIVGEIAAWMRDNEAKLEPLFT